MERNGYFPPTRDKHMQQSGRKTHVFNMLHVKRRRFTGQPLFSASTAACQTIYTGFDAVFRSTLAFAPIFCLFVGEMPFRGMWIGVGIGIGIGIGWCQSLINYNSAIFSGEDGQRRTRRQIRKCFARFGNCLPAKSHMQSKSLGCAG